MLGRFFYLTWSRHDLLLTSCVLKTMSSTSMCKLEAVVVWQP